jgi:hypothetical protein
MEQLVQAQEGYCSSELTGAMRNQRERMLLRVARNNIRSLDSEADQLPKRAVRARPKKSRTTAPEIRKGP